MEWWIFLKRLFYSLIVYAFYSTHSPQQHIRSKTPQLNVNLTTKQRPHRPAVVDEGCWVVCGKRRNWTQKPEEDEDEEGLELESSKDKLPCPNGLGEALALFSRCVQRDDEIEYEDADWGWGHEWISYVTDIRWQKIHWEDIFYRRPTLWKVVSSLLLLWLVPIAMQILL